MLYNIGDIDIKIVIERYINILRRRGYVDKKMTYDSVMLLFLSDMLEDMISFLTCNDYDKIKSILCFITKSHIDIPNLDELDATINGNDI